MQTDAVSYCIYFEYLLSAIIAFTNHHPGKNGEHQIVIKLVLISIVILNDRHLPTTVHIFPPILHRPKDSYCIFMSY